MSVPNQPVTFVAPSIPQLAPLFPGYEIQMLIATGGMGAVYRAVQKSLDRTVAIKILPHEFSRDEAFCKGFEAEAKAMARLNHPNLISVYDFGEVSGMLYIVMEYVPGKSLFHSSHGMAIDPAEVIRLVSGICNGLAHAHENGILHRDIKPSNILLDLNAEPKIGDFGLARPIDRKIQEGEEIFGTPHYTAPEVVELPHSVDFRADIFSVGVLLHELLTGKLPADDRRPASAISHCDPRFDAIIRRATQPQPELRYASAAEITRELHAIASTAGPRILKTASTGSAAPIRPGPLPHPSHHPAAKPLASPQSSAGGIGIALAAVVGVVVVFVLLSKSADTPAPPASTAGQQGPAFSPHGSPMPGERNSQSAPAQRPKTPPPTDLDEPAAQATAGNADEDSGEPTPSRPDDSATAVADETAESADEPPTVPKFNVPGFLLRARTIMQDRATPLIASCNKNLTDNLRDFERRVKRLIRRVESRDDRHEAAEDFEEFIEQCLEAGGRLPGKPGGNFGIGRDFTDLHEEFLEKQQAFEDSLIQALARLSATYILGLEKQVERLQTENDPAAIALIEEEIEKTRENPDYFPELMLGTHPGKSTRTPGVPAGANRPGANAWDRDAE